MVAVQNFAQTFAGEKCGLRAFEFYFFEFLAPFALKFGFGKRRLARKFIDQREKRLGKFAEAAKRNRTGILSGARRKIGAEPPQILFDLTAGTFRGAGANHRRGHFGEARRAM